MGKAENSGSDKARFGQRQNHGEKGIPWIGTQSRRDFQRTDADSLERLLQGLHDKRHGIKDRGDDQTSEGEG